MSVTRIMVSAGEASGDTHLAQALIAVQQRRADLQIFGMGGQGLADAGAQIVVHCTDVAVVGLIEPLLHYVRIRRALEKLKQTLKRRRPHLLILADFPDFNLRLAAYAKSLGVHVLYYISPQVWAWRRQRVWKIAQCVDTLATIFPFEAQYYAPTGLDVHYVGHPLLDEIDPSLTRERARAQLGVSERAKVLALLPGSRAGEVSRLAPEFIEAAKKLQDQVDLTLLPIATTIQRDQLPSTQNIKNLQLMDGDAHTALAAADLAIVASGTATLEAAVIGTPMLVGYRLNALSYFLVKRLIKIPDIALVNIVAEKRICAEFLQNDCNAENLSVAATQLLNDETRLSTQTQALREVKEKLGDTGHFDNLCTLIMQAIEQSKTPS